MCARCEANKENDPRRRAFISAGVVEIVPQSEMDKEQNPDGSFEGLAPMAEVKVYADSGLAKFESFTMMRDPKLAKVSHNDYSICLN